MTEIRIFRVRFVNQGKIYELYARSVHQDELYGFITVEGLMFGEHTGVLIDPEEERLKTEFEGVNRTLVPIHSVIRIDEVEKKGQSKIFDLKSDSNITPFPTPFYGPGKGPTSS